MDLFYERLHRLSEPQLKALLLFGTASKGIISSSAESDKIGKTGKALGGIFSSLSRQSINGQRLLTPWGRSSQGRGLKWKLNTDVVSQNRLTELVRELLV